MINYACNISGNVPSFTMHGECLSLLMKDTWMLGHMMMSGHDPFAPAALDLLIPNLGCLDGVSAVTSAEQEIWLLDIHVLLTAV